MRDCKTLRIDVSIYIDVNFYIHNIREAGLDVRGLPAQAIHRDRLRGGISRDASTRCWKYG
jgi:hypothetical protein